MPIRSRSHVLEDVSKREFHNLLPPEWTTFEPRDYGIDGMVEIFSNSRTTGKFFNYQLKATDNENLIKALKVSIEIETLKYYETCDLPTLIVRYCSVNNSFYGIWSDEIKIPTSKSDQITFTINFNETMILTTEKLLDFNQYIDLFRIRRDKNLGMPYGVKLNVDNEVYGEFSKPRLLLAIENEVKKYPSLLSIEDAENPVIVDVKRGGVKSSFLNYYLVDINFNNDSLEQIVGCVLLSIAYLITDYMPNQSINIYLLESFLKSKKINESGIKKVIEKFERTSDYESIISLLECLDIEDLLILMNDLELSILFHFIKFRITSIELVTRYNALVEKIAQSGHFSRIDQSRMYYNIANSLGNTLGMERQSLSLYIKARKYDETYATRHYYWSEIGSVLFRLNRFKFAHSAYCKSYEIEKDDWLIPRIADCCFMLGEYQKASNIFTNYLTYNKQISNRDASWICKLNMILDINDLLKINTQIRCQARSIELISECNSINEEKLLAPLRTDALNSIAWFNLGVYYSKRLNFYKTFQCFRNCVVLDTNDFESWRNAFTSLLNSNDAYLEVYFLLKMMFEIHGQNIIVQTLVLSEEHGFPPEVENMIYQILDDFINEDISEENSWKFEFRLIRSVVSRSLPSSNTSVPNMPFI